MLSLDIIKQRPWIVSLACTIFVLYTNIAWFMCGSAFDDVQILIPFAELFAIRFFYIWLVFWLLIRFTLSKPKMSLPRRILNNLLLSLVAFAGYWVIRMQFDVYEAVSLPTFQFLVIGLLSSMLGYIYLFYIEQREKDKEIERLQIESLKSRCAALTNQIHPHFFFNSLNGVSALVRKSDNSCTLAYIDKLSDIFRYILQSDNKSLVTLNEELAFVEAFRHIMEVRFANKFQIEVDVKAEYRNLRLPILSLLPLLENVTVHNMIDSEHRMTIGISINEERELIVTNPIYPKLSAPDTNGTGLQNLENRFRLMLGTEIKIIDDGKSFTVVMPLK